MITSFPASNFYTYAVLTFNSLKAIYSANKKLDSHKLTELFPRERPN